MPEKDLSFGQLVNKNQMDHLQIPANVMENFNQENFLVVIAPRSNILKINVFPTESEKIIKIVIKLEEFSPYIVKKIASIIRKLNLPNLYTSGMCIQETECVYEAYIEYSKLDVSLEEVRENFETIANIKSVEIEELKTK